MLSITLVYGDMHLEATTLTLSSLAGVKGNAARLVKVKLKVMHRDYHTPFPAYILIGTSGSAVLALYPLGTAKLNGNTTRGPGQWFHFCTVLVPRVRLR